VAAALTLLVLGGVGAVSGGVCHDLIHPV
jgi:hypothetical protein